MSFGYDPEAIYQDADIEQWEYERQSAEAAALEARGICTHQSRVGLGADGKAHYPLAEGLKPGETICWQCEQVFNPDGTPRG